MELSVVVLGLELIAVVIIVAGLLSNWRQHRQLDEVRAEIERQSSLLQRELERADRRTQGASEEHVEH